MQHGCRVWRAEPRWRLEEPDPPLKTPRWLFPGDASPMIQVMDVATAGPLHSGVAVNLRDIAFLPKDEPLREDVRILGALVGDVIREQGGERLFDTVEKARHAAIRRREGDAGAAGDVEAALAGLSAGEAAEVVRAFSTYFQVVNLAERVHRVRRGRQRMLEDTAPQADSLADAVRRLAATGSTPAEAAARFSGAIVEPVFTAHPTESTRRAILKKQERIAGELISRLDPTRTPHEERVALARMREDITAAWQTEEHPSVRPTVADERDHVLYYVIRVLYRVVPALHERLDEALRDIGADPQPGRGPLVRVGSWVGGDMDGNPNVDAATIRETLRLQRDLVLEAYAREVEELAGYLSQSSSRIGWSEELSETIDRYSEWFPEVAASIPARHRNVGYRVALHLMHARLEATRADSQHAYDGPHALREDLATIISSLEGHRGERAGLFGVRRLARRVDSFGFHLATLDVRQDARELRDVIADLMGDPEWPSRPAEQRAGMLSEWMRDGPDAVLGAGAPGSITERGRSALEVFEAIRESRRIYGTEAIGSYIVSMAQNVDDVLSVLWLARVAGLGSSNDVPLDVAPLLETVPDLERAGTVVEDLCADPVASAHLRRRGERLMVMVGYSDSNKDGGIASARWALQQALSSMAEAAGRHGIRLTVFHGRGGTVSRGGGSVHRAVAAMPAAAMGGRLRITEQGEVIDAKYGLPQIALRNLERMLGAMVLRSCRSDRDDVVPAQWTEMADVLAAAARRSYRALVYEDARFTAYFRGATPIDVIERMAIGSRPASRRSGAGVEDLRAIPWVFAWTQCRAMITGWYGLGAGLEAAERACGPEVLRAAAADWPFFDALLSDVEMVLAKADIGISATYSQLAPAGSRAVFESVRSEFQRTVGAVLDIRGMTSLLDGDPTLQRSIRLRNPYVDPMNVLQVDLLRRWRAKDRPEGDLFGALLETVNGIARGLQNTG